MRYILDRVPDQLYIFFMGKGQQTATWVFMMLTFLRKRNGLTLKNFIPITKKYGLVRFLTEQYELLHYYDNDYIIEDIIRYIEEQGGNANELSGT